jgi:hypothetical protein
VNYECYVRPFSLTQWLTSNRFSVHVWPSSPSYLFTALVLTNPQCQYMMSSFMGYKVYLYNLENRVVSEEHLITELMMDVCSIMELIGTGGRCTIRFCMFELWSQWAIARLSQQIFKCNDILLWLPQSMWLDHGNMPHIHNDILLISLLPPCVNNFVPIMQSYHAVAIPTIDINPLTDGSFKF